VGSIDSYAYRMPIAPKPGVDVPDDVAMPESADGERVETAAQILQPGGQP
jgi:hypothetical protein